LAELAAAQKTRVATHGSPTELIPQLERIKADQANLDTAKLLLSYTQIRAPISGVLGLRLVDPGNIVRSTDQIVNIAQLRPINVSFALPEEVLPQVRAALKQRTTLPVEAWNRDHTLRIATGRLTAIDNQIDQSAGTVRLKAAFDNNDDALFPNQFVNVRLRLNPR
jgi:multidrug efflux system membrane fusion protein